MLAALGDLLLPLQLLLLLLLLDLLKPGEDNGVMESANKGNVFTSYLLLTDNLTYACKISKRIEGCNLAYHIEMYVMKMNGCNEAYHIEMYVMKMNGCNEAHQSF